MDIIKVETARRKAWEKTEENKCLHGRIGQVKAGDPLSMFYEDANRVIRENPDYFSDAVTTTGNNHETTIHVPGTNIVYRK
ncbi:hypothetical protein COS75_00265 [Candidatus Pacearchaeota archaeon CG06_land_8_20_14_3_00_35_12]|nr:MAG: hypothetical protein COS75_00265 [Candidatus Pacearchaeota archaeon CG06_land_8_20_14_3_00_35_12]